MKSRWLIAASSIAILMGSVAQGASAPTRHTVIKKNAAPVAGAAGRVTPPSQPWAHERNNVRPESDVRFGTLANGMRYAIMHNATPPGQASVWLRIDAGSLMEKDNQLGLAHFMEHMAFNGTRHIPKNDLIHMLERLGLAFGADLNAATGYDQTFYQLNMPRSDDESLDAAVFVLRDRLPKR